MTTESLLVDTLGMIAGGIWISAAVYFQLIRDRPAHPGYVASLLLIGIALTMASSALAFAGRPGTVQLLALIANALFIVIGIGVSYAIEVSTELQEAQCPVDTDTDPSQP